MDPTRNSQRVLCVFLTLSGMPMTSPGQIHMSHSAMPVKVEIIQACTISAADLDFGQYNLSSSSPLLGQTAIQMTCGAGVLAELSLDGGLTGQNTSNRRMTRDAGKDTLDYDLFQDAGRSIHWGDKSGKDTREVLSTGETQSVPIYGQIPAGQRAAGGTYSDQITVQLQF